LPTKKLKEDTLTVRQGNTNKNCYFIGYKTYQLLPNNELIFAGGGICDDSETELVKAFILGNKKVYHKYESVVIKEYNEVVEFGKHKGLTVNEIFKIEKSWLSWCRDNFKFNLAQENLKKQITEILKQ
jgi:hypothetical protein